VTPDHADHVDVAERNDDGRNHKDVGRQEREVGLPLPPRRVSAASTLVLDFTVRVHAFSYLQAVYTDT